MDATLPQKLFVVMEDDGDGDYFPVANATIDHLDTGAKVGVYELKDTKTVAVTTALL